jgi:hypothetical protein
MRIWLVIGNNDNGLTITAYAAEVDARAAYAYLVRLAWHDVFPGTRCPADIDEAYHRMSAVPGFENFLYLRWEELIPAA